MIDLHYAANNVSSRVNNSFKILIIDYMYNNVFSAFCFASKQCAMKF